MLKLLLIYRHISLFFLFVLLSLALLSFNRPAETLETSNVMEQTMLFILQPFQNAASLAITEVHDIWQGYLALVNLQKENERLQQENKRLRIEKTLLEEKAQAYDRLKGTLGLVEERKFSTILARVIGYDSTNQSNTIIVNRGSQDGVHESWPVITQDGIVGMTVAVSTNASKVLLLTDPNCNVAALIQRTRDQGIVGGQSKQDAYLMKYVNRRADIRAGTVYQLTEPTLRGLALEGVPGFVLTPPIFALLEQDGVPADMLTILEDMADRFYPTQQQFMAMLETTLGRDQAKWYQAIILKHARAGILAQLEALLNQIFVTRDGFLDALNAIIGQEGVALYQDLILRYAQEQEVVISSGLGGIFPKGLLIGTVSNVVKRDYGLFQYIEVAPNVDFSKLEEVLIIRRQEQDAIE